MAFSNLNALWAAAVVDELVRATGAREAVVCPGSRSAPLAIACAEHRRLRTRVVVDERSAGFFALGVGKQSGVPALVVVTSGTAGAHLHPAMVEAASAGVPLVAITADRPWELHGWGAPQTVFQERLFADFPVVRLSLPAPDASPEVIAHLRAEVSRVGARARKPRPGPVHLNVPFREPLAPTPDGIDLTGLSELLQSGRPDETPFVAFSGDRPVDVAAIAQVRARVAGAARGVIVCGPRDADDGLAHALAQLSTDTGYPVLAEAASQVRFAPGSAAVSTYDLFLRSEELAALLRPQLVLRFGGGVTSKRLQAWLDASGAPVVLFNEAGQLFDPNHRAEQSVEGPSEAACQALLGARRADPEWRSRFLAVDAQARRELVAAFQEGDGLTEPRVVHEVAAALPSGAQLFVASSMPIRDLDAFAHRSSAGRVLSNRGVNGIDGLVSTALGAAVAAGRPTVLLTGDLGLVHDLGGLWTAKQSDVPLCIVVVNNDGGGIFSFLPIARATPRFEALFGTPHGSTFEGAAAMAGARYVALQSASALRRALPTALESGLWILEVKTDRATNVAVHDELGARVVRALAEKGRPS